MRFPNNNNPNDASAYYFGELNEAGGVTATQFSTNPAERSANFPAGGMLTPGAPNVGGPSVLSAKPSLTSTVTDALITLL